MTPTLVFWQGIPSIHQAPLLRELARQWTGQVVVVAEDGVPPTRMALGWAQPDFSPAQLIVRPTAEERECLIRRTATPGDVHIFSGFHAEPRTYATLKRVGRTAATIGVFAERGRDDDGPRAVARRARYRLHALRWRRRLRFVVATGELAVEWFKDRGFPAERVFPFGYFVERVTTEPRADNGGHGGRSQGGTGPVRLLFVGELAHRKGVDLLLSALGAVRGADWQLDVLGDGAEREHLETLAQHLGLAGRVRWLGVRPNGEVRFRASEADVLVLPSRYDGWGAVVNEALMAGARVVVSDACGASDLVSEAWRGVIFKAGCIQSLADALQRVISEGSRSAAERARIRGWADQAIAPEVAARYLSQIAEHFMGKRARPAVPWRAHAAAVPLG